MRTIRISRAFGAAVALVSAFLMASCTDENAGSPQRGPEASESSPVNFPKVRSPLDPAPFLENPCALVPDVELEAFGAYEPGRPDVDSNEAKNLLGPGCNWDPVDLGDPVAGLRIDLPRRESADKGFKGMEAIYKAKESGDIDHLQPLQLAGHPEYPAAVNGKVKEINEGTCTIDVGIADDLTFDVLVIDDEDPENACKMAHKLAEVALNSMVEGA